MNSAILLFFLNNWRAACMLILSVLLMGTVGVMRIELAVARHRVAVANETLAAERLEHSKALSEARKDALATQDRAADLVRTSAKTFDEKLAQIRAFYRRRADAAAPVAPDGVRGDAQGFLALGCAAGILSSCTKADCADVGECATPEAVGADAAADAKPDAEAAPPSVTNPYGAAYPTENLGWTPRATGSSPPGQVLPNVVFDTGVARRMVAPLTDVAPITSLQFADFYDPEGRTHDVVILVLATEWDASTPALMEGLQKDIPRTKTICALGEGALPNGAPTLANFQEWANRYYWTWHVLDPVFEKLQPFDKEDYPAVVLVDARTMEIAYFKTGPVQVSEIETQVAAIRARPPSY